MVHNRRFIVGSSFQQPQKQVRSIQVWKTVTTVTLWHYKNVNVTDFMMQQIFVPQMYNLRYGRTCWQQSMVSMTISMVVQRMLIREGRSFFIYGEICRSLQLQIKGLNGTINFHGPFLEYLYTMSVYINKFQHPLQVPIFGLRITVHHVVSFWADKFKLQSSGVFS